jgi:DNA-3-methyladenine glycosylase II
MTALINTADALKYFKTNDQKMHYLLSSALNSSMPLTTPDPHPPKQYFQSIVDAIVGQQISVSAANAIRGRVHALLDQSVTPEHTLQVSPSDLRACGLSNRKVEYLQSNARIWHTLPIDDFTSLTDEEIITALISLRGVGRWTAEMFLLFSIARPDIFSYGDLGLMQGLRQLYGYHPHYTRKIRHTVENWSPHRSLASLALWHQRDSS